MRDLKEKANSQKKSSENINVRLEESLSFYGMKTKIPLIVVIMKQRLQERFDINRLFRDMENQKTGFSLCGLEVKFSDAFLFCCCDCCEKDAMYSY